MPKQLVLAILFVTTIPGAGYLMADEPLISDRALKSAGLVRYWEARLPLGSQETIKNGHLVDGSLYVTTNRGVLYALDAEVGLIRWAQKVSKPGFAIGEPTHLADAPGLDPVLVPTSARLFALNRFSGETLQTFDVVLPRGGRVVGFQNALFMGGIRPQLYGFLWLTCPAGGLSPLWGVDVGAQISAGPILFDQDSLLFGTRGGHAIACQARDKRLLWSTYSGGSFVGNPAVDEIGVYLANKNRSLYKLNIDTGCQIWRKRFQNPLDTGPIVVAHLVFQFCPEFGLTAIDADTGRERWRDPEGLTLAAHLGDRDAVFTTNRRLKIHDHETGAVLGSVDAPRVFAAVTNGRSDAAYLLAPGGTVLCVRPGGTPYLKSHEMAAARNSLNWAPDTSQKGETELGIGETQEQTDAPDNPFRSKRDIRP